MRLKILLVDAGHPYDVGHEILSHKNVKKEINQFLC